MQKNNEYLLKILCFFVKNKYNLFCRFFIFNIKIKKWLFSLFYRANSNQGGKMEHSQSKIGFNSALYLKKQSERILERIERFDNKLYLEFGGKLFDDLHASRVLPGFEPDIKTKLLITLKDKAEIVFCISAGDIERNRIRADLGLSYDNEVLRLIDSLRGLGLFVSSVVITLFKGQPSAIKFGQKLEMHGEKVYFHSYTKGYPSDVDTIVSDEGYGMNPYIETSRPLVIVTAPGPSSGKLATCLSQLYHDYKKGIRAGYAKFETFPVWNLPLKHPVNIAYESATADLKDINQIDPYHFNEYGVLTVNYNRDIEVFPVLKNILKKITGENIYKSPTDMGVNMVASAITNEDVVIDAAKREVVRRNFRAECDYKRGQISFDTLERTRYLMSELDIKDDYLDVVPVAKTASKTSGYPCLAIKLDNGEFVWGKNKTVISASGAAVLNSLRSLAELDDCFDIISDDILMPIIKLRKNSLHTNSQVLSLDDVLVALSISASNNEKAKKAIEKLPELKGCEAHATFILPPAEELTLKKLGINVTCEPIFLNNNLFEDK